MRIFYWSSSHCLPIELSNYYNCSMKLSLRYLTFYLEQIMLLLGGLPFLWRISGDLMKSYGYDTQEYEVCTA